jgi:hypothetical protein
MRIESQLPEDDLQMSSFTFLSWSLVWSLLSKFNVPLAK